MIGTVGSRIKFLRTSAGMNQKKLGFLIQMSLQAISNYETNARQPSLTELEKINAAIAPVLGDQLFFLVTGKQPNEYINNLHLHPNHINRIEVIKKLNDFLVDMEVQGEIMIKGSVNELVVQFGEDYIQGKKSADRNGTDNS